ncbi:MAG: transglycosylase domain-containing protein [Chloroflexi bacterium]|nr:transglycosylase domain-containing protein [Chloroflexota bacterium]
MDRTQPNTPYSPQQQAQRQAPRRAARTRKPTRTPRTRFGKLGCMLSPQCLIGCLGIVSVFICGSLVALFLAYASYSSRVQAGVDNLEARLDALEDPSNIENFETTYIYDRQGRQLYEIFGEGRRRRVPFNEIPDYVKWATISTEDDNFYDNPGVDVSSVIRSARDYFLEGRVVSGASTITQQLVRNIAFEPEYRAERTFTRKMDEAILALTLNQMLTKDEILELYLNEIYYGNLAYGIEAASQVYFGKPATQLELHEAALLAGLPQSPAELDPLNPDPIIQQRVTERHHLVLDLMAEEGYITEQEALEAKQTQLIYSSPEIPLDKAPHFVVYSQDRAEDILVRLGYSPELLANGGLRIYTSIDMDFQTVAEDSARTRIADLRNSNNVTNAAVVVIHPPSGEILAMVGSVNYDDPTIDGQVNVALAQRQPGSTMKPFTYSAAMEQGWSAGTIIWDTSVDIGIPGQPTYSPVNYDRRFHGPVRVRAALANSYNVAAVKTLRKVGVQYLLDFMKRFGVQSLNRDASNYGLSLTLGGGEVTLLELTNGFATFGRDGNYVSPHSILCIVDKNDNILYQYENRCGNFGTFGTTDRTFNDTVVSTPVLDPRIAFVISDILSDNAARSPAMGANSPLNTGDLLTSVKTGTTDDFRDNWTVGYTNDLAVGVWSGNSDNTPMSNISGLQGAAPIWHDTMLGIYNSFDFPPSTLPVPPGVTQQRICNINTLSDPANSCGSFQTEWYLDGGPLLPDGQGGLAYYDVGASQTNASQYGPQLSELEPGIFQTYVRPLAPEQANILASQNSRLPQPKYCLVPQEIIGQVTDASLQIFIDHPDLEDEARGAYNYAYGANDPILPWYPCTPDTVVGGAQPSSGEVVGYITSPTANQTVSGDVVISGVVQYPPNASFTYYKLQVIGGPFPNWTTLGETHSNQVPAPAQLEVFQASALPPGQYELELVVFGSIGEHKFRVPITLTSP